MDKKDQETLKKIQGYEASYKELVKNFSNFRIKLNSYSKKALTKITITQLRKEVDKFIKDNKLKVNVDIIVYNNSIQILGKTLEDAIIWESIQSIK